MLGKSGKYEEKQEQPSKKTKLMAVSVCGLPASFYKHGIFILLVGA
jgi:hypothetical protein